METTKDKTNDEINQEIDVEKIIHKKRAYLFFKRVFDIIISGTAIICLLPFYIIVSILILCTSRGGIFYLQTRIGKNQKPFKIIKFRTMYKNSDKQGLLTVGKDKRITGIGKILRKTKLDEMPQLFNVFAGQMSFVGPRPEVEKYVNQYSDYQKKILQIKPGITELASIVYRNENEVLGKADDYEEAYVSIVMQEKLKYNFEYVQKMSLWYDFKLIIKTITSIFR